MSESSSSNPNIANRLLIVDDALIMRKRIGKIAESAGWQIAGEARDGVEAIELYEQLKPDLVTLDIVMPRLDGVSTLKRIMEIDPNARIVMVSAVDQKNKLAECIASGVMDFIVKPFERTVLHGFFEKSLSTPTSE